MLDLKKYDVYMKEIIRQIPDVVNKYSDLNVDTKSDSRDLVTVVDKAVEEFITTSILSKFPNHEILGEESYDENKTYKKDNLWVIDPIDGTVNFVKQGEGYGSIISFFKDGKPALAYIYDIQNDILCHSMAGGGVFINDEKVKPLPKLKLEDVLVSMDVRRVFLKREEFFKKLVSESFGIRAHGSCAIDGLKLVSGKIGAYINQHSGPWDFSAFMLISNELNIKFTKYDLSELSLDEYSGFILANSSVYDDIIKLL